jgi:hypothetical protein
MAETATYTCSYEPCGRPFTARTSERRRGWALYCSRSCKGKAEDHACMRSARGDGTRHQGSAQALEAGWFGQNRSAE